MSQALLIPGRGTFRPESLGNLHAYYDAASIAATDGGRLSQWNDLSGNGHHATQATTGKQPAYAASAVNGRPGVRFANARADALATTAFGAVAEPATVVIVGKLPSSTPAATQFLFEGSASGRRGIFETTGRALGEIGQTTGPSSAAQPNASVAVIVAVYDGANSFVRINGVRTAATTGTAQSPTLWTIGSNNAQTQSFDGWIACAAVYSRALATPDISRIERWAARRFGRELARDAVYYINAAAGSDANDGRFASTPFLTLAKAKTAHAAGFSASPTQWNLTAPEATPFREALVWDKEVALTVVPETAGQRWYHYASEKFTSGWTLVSGGVYSRAHSAYDPTFGAFVSDVADGDGLWTRLTNNTSTPTTPGAGQYGWSANVLYVHLADGSDPNTHSIEIARYNHGWEAWKTGALSLSGGCVRGGRLGCIRPGSSTPGDTGYLDADDMYAEYGGTGGGFATVGAFGRLTVNGGHSWANANDGVNVHGDSGHNGETTITDLDCAYNLDEGFSCHDDTVATMTGGRLHHNASGGATHVNQAAVTMTGVEVDRNRRTDAGSAGDTGGINYLDTTSGTITGCNAHDNPAQGILVKATASVTVSGNTSGTAAGNGLADNLAA